MPLYDYQAIDRKGKKHKGRLDSVNLKAAKQSLQSQGLMILNIKAQRDKSQSGRGTKTTRSSLRIKSKTITEFTRQFSVLQATSIPYDRALEILIQESKDPAFLQILSSIKAKVMEGSTFAQALESFEKQFSRMYVAMVKAGEAGGSLPKVLAKLAMYLEETETLKNKLQSALIYPIVMSLMGVAIVIFMMTFILPKILPLFEQFEVELPLPTKIVIFLSEVISQGWWAIIIMIVCLIFGLKKFRDTEKGKLVLDRLLLKIPVLNQMLSKIYHYRFTQTLATLMMSGVEVKQALMIVSQVTGSKVYELECQGIIQAVTQKGFDLSMAIKNTGLFTPSIIQMIRVGEETGQLQTMLDQVALNLEREVKDQVEKGVALLEPILIILMALMVGFIVISVMLPMFALNQLV